MKKRLKGLLAFWLCVVMLVGGSMTVLAAGNYYINDQGVLYENSGASDMQVTAEHVIEEGSLISGSGNVILVFENETGNELFKYTPADGSKEIPEQASGTVKVVNSPEDKTLDGTAYKFTKVVMKADSVDVNIGSEEAASTAEPALTTPTPITCDHDADLIYELWREPTEEQDGEWAHRCSKCFEVLQKFPICGMGEFFKRVIREVNGAELNETVTITTDRWMSFNKDVYDALAARSDVALTVNYRYQGKFYTVTIPAGTDMTPYLTEDGYCGFLYLAVLFGATEVVSE